jgi:hypothetical protein
VSRWLQTEPPVGNNQLYKNREKATWEISREERGGVCGEGQPAGSRGMSISGRVSVRGYISLAFRRSIFHFVICFLRINSPGLLLVEMLYY